MKRPIAHQINDVARGWFNARLPREWVRNEHVSDYAIDYTVELAKTNDVTGVTFLVQLKGTEEATLRRDGSFSFSLQRKHAKYYVEKARQAVFLILVDIEAETAYWLFIQEHLDDLEKVKNWRSKSKVVVRVPKRNLLSNAAELETAVLHAQGYMARRLVQFRERSLRELDPRFEVQVRQTSSLEEIVIRPLEPVNFRLIVPNDHATRTKWKGLSKRGYLPNFSPVKCD